MRKIFVTVLILLAAVIMNFRMTGPVYAASENISFRKLWDMTRSEEETNRTETGRMYEGEEREEMLEVGSRKWP